MKNMIFGGLMVTVAVLGVVGTASADEPYCREYQRTVTIGGQVQNSYGTACLQPDGSWKVATDDGTAQVDSSAGLQVANLAPMYAEPQQQVVVYDDEPIYTNYRYYPGPSWGLNLDWSNYGGWRGGRGGGWGGGHDGGWHGGGGHGWHGR